MARNPAVEVRRLSSLLIRRDKPRRDKPRRDKPRRDKPRRDKPRRDKRLIVALLARKSAVILSPKKRGS
jgi:hypothetical protein